MKTLTELGVIGMSQRFERQQAEAQQARRERGQALRNWLAAIAIAVGNLLIVWIAGVLTTVGIFGMWLQFFAR